MQPRSARLLIFIAIFLIAVSVLSQSGRADLEELRRRCERALQYRDEALSLYGTRNYTEALEEKLNSKALKELKQVIPMLDGSPVATPEMILRVRSAAGELEHYFGNADAALAQYQQALQQKGKAGLEDSLFFRTLLYAGLIHYGKGQIDSAASIFMRADSIQQRYKIPLEESQRLYNTLGVLDYEAGNYRQAKNHFRKALDMINKDDPFFLDLESNYLINLAQAQAKLEEYDDALAIYGQLIHMGKNSAEIRHNIALIRIEQGKAEEAINILQHVRFEGMRQAQVHNSRAKAWLLLGDTVNSRKQIDSALAINTGSSQDIAILGISRQIEGDIHMLKDEEGQALKSYTQAIGHFYPSFNAAASDSIPQVFTGVFSYISLYHALLAKAGAYHRLYTKAGGIGAAKKELECYRSAYKLLDHVMDTYESDDARLFISRTRNSTHDLPIAIAYELYSKTKDTSYLNALYFLDQQNKASVLALNVINAASPDDPVKNEAAQIRKQITRISMQVGNSRDSLAISEANRKIMDLELGLSKLEGRGLKKDWQRIPSPTELQALLDKRSVILSYHLSDSQLTTTTISAAGISVSRKPLPRNFGKWIQEITSSMHKPEEAIPSSAELYHLLLDDALEYFPSRIVIIPDNELHYLPFEALTDNKGRYALEQFSVQYHYSTAFLKKDKEEATGDNMISFAPFASSGAGGYERLAYSSKEIGDNPGLVLFDSNATREAFIRRSGISGTIHLATHAQASGVSGGSFLVFRNGKGAPELLYENEIYTLDLRSNHLIMLSACETASGNLLKGEGVMSLARAFTYAGCENIITTLWKADDRSTTYLMLKFRSYLDKGYARDIALQQAKMDLLKDPKIHPREKHPYYWAHFIYIGNYQPSGKQVSAWIIAALILTAFGIGIFIRKRFFS